MEENLEEKTGWHGILVPALFVAGVIVILVIVKVIIS